MIFNRSLCQLPAVPPHVVEDSLSKKPAKKGGPSGTGESGEGLQLGLDLVYGS